MVQSKTLYEWSHDLKNELDRILKTKKVIEKGITYIVYNEIINIEIPDEFWNLLMEDEYFRRVTTKGKANIGGYGVKKGPKLKVNYEETRVMQHTMISSGVYKRKGGRGRPRKDHTSL